MVSVGRLNAENGCSLIWRAGERPYFETPDGREVRMRVHACVPHLTSLGYFAVARERTFEDMTDNEGESDSEKKPEMTYKTRRWCQFRARNRKGSGVAAAQSGETLAVGVHEYDTWFDSDEEIEDADKLYDQETSLFLSPFDKRNVCRHLLKK